MLLVSASLSFGTPVGYQTNLMVLFPGNYAFSDFARFGFPLQFILVFATAFVAPFVFPA